MQKILFLPGAGGSPTFWRPVAERLPSTWEKAHFGWPGLGDQPHDTSVGSVDDLVALVEARVHEPVDIVAQSMGGIIAARLALSRPEMVRRLVLVAAPTGVDAVRLGAVDWRPAYRTLYPRAANWIYDVVSTKPLPVEQITSPTLLIWGDADSISPVAVGRHLKERMPNAKLRVLEGGNHDLASNKADLVADLIVEHLA